MVNNLKIKYLSLWQKFIGLLLETKIKMKEITTTTQYIEELSFHREPCHALDFIENKINCNGTVHFEIRKVCAVPYQVDDYYKIEIEMSFTMKSGNQVTILNMDMLYCIEAFVEGCSSEELYQTLFVEIPSSHIADIQQAISSLTTRSGYVPAYIPGKENFDFLQIFEDNELESLEFPTVGNQYLS